MAKRILLEAYKFDPANRQITITGRYLKKEQLILITNVTSNTVIYNFADSSLTATQVPTIINNNESTLITLAYNTTGMAVDSKLSILIEEINETFQPSEVLQDPIGKLRVSLPQSLIDTDFEYGVQQTKWEALGLMNNRPSAYYDTSTAVSVISISAPGGAAPAWRTMTVTIPYNTTGTFNNVASSSTITLTGTLNFPLQIGMQLITSVGGFPVGTTIIGTGTIANTWVLSNVGTGLSNTAMQFGYPITTATPIFIQDTIYPNANGWVIPATVTVVPSTTVIQSFTYYARDSATSIPATTNIFDPYKSYMFLGSFYSGAGIPIVSGTGDSTRGFTVVSGNTVQCITALPHGLTVGSGIFVVNNITSASNQPVQNLIGNWVVKSVTSAVTFTFDTTAAPSVPTIAVNGSGLTINFTSIGGAIVTAVVNAGGSNYVVGDVVRLNSTGTTCFLKIMATNISGATVGIVTQVGIYAAGSGYPATGTAGATDQAASIGISGSILYARSWGSSVHRPFDGGVQFSAGLPYHGNQVIRQTRRYFRYQSGKGIQFNTGSNFCAPYQVESLTSSGTTISVTTKYPHNLGIGAVVRVSGCDDPNYNGTWTVSEIPTNDNVFKYISTLPPSVSPATGGATGQGTNIIVQPYQWYGAQVRTGMFDSQNGFFFQYDGQTVFAVRRSSTTQLAGVISNLGSGNQIVTGTGTRFVEQLLPGDFIVIRGQSYAVVSIDSQTQMTIYPDYRGAAIVAPVTAVISKTIDLKIPQSEWNIDTCLPSTAAKPGTSGFVLDVTKMQMYLMDFTWYGAGPIRWGFKNHRGEAMYVHRLAHGNNMPEAYMRSGNLPARYEVNTYWPITKATATILSSEVTSISVLSTEGFPPAGFVCVQAAGNTTSAVTEFIQYTGKTTTSFTGLTRARTNIAGPGNLSNASGTACGGIGTAQTFTFSSTTNIISVCLYAPQSGATISHWGSAVMMDGRYDDDKSVVFNYGMSAPVTYPNAGTRYPVFSVRLSPSVDSGYTGLLGIREIVNRMQLQPVSCGIFVTGAGVRVEVFLNARITAGTFTPVGGSSLAQYSAHPVSAPFATLTGGECIYTFFAPANGVSTQDMSKVRDLGNSILGGGNTLAVPGTTSNVYPDGPDIITVCVTPLTGGAVLAARLNWSEAQA